MKEHAIKWLARNREAFGSSDGYPAEFHRAELFKLIGPRSKVAILSPQGQLRAGTVQIFTPGSHGAVLEANSRGGSPFLVDRRNIVWCGEAPATLKTAAQLIRKQVKAAIAGFKHS